MFPLYRPENTISTKLNSDMRSATPSTKNPSSRPEHFASSSLPNRDYIIGLADPDHHPSLAEGGSSERRQKHAAVFTCSLCRKRFTRAYDLRSHLRTHSDERPFPCTVCGKAFARQLDRKRHEGLHSEDENFVYKGERRRGTENQSQSMASEPDQERGSRSQSDESLPLFALPPSPPSEPDPRDIAISRLLAKEVARRGSARPRMPPSDRLTERARAVLGESSNGGSNGLADLQHAARQLEQASSNLRLTSGSVWGYGRRSAGANALGRHFRTEHGRVCIGPLLDEEAIVRQRLGNKQQLESTWQEEGVSVDNIGPAGVLPSKWGA